ncbi:RtcB family protein, partial [Acinetobacter junii]|uniref:RtcB family protein n=1 Tax=Acinetobacter junii TaxID=40215 RepID=UPI001D187ED3
EAINCHHNYVSRENHYGEDLLITRKGAIRAGLDELGIIPGSMLDVHDPISGEYALEVSSPGWDRPFFQLNQLPAYIGQQVALR